LEELPSLTPLTPLLLNKQEPLQEPLQELLQVPLLVQLQPLETL
jgi:hypothetical protein